VVGHICKNAEKLYYFPPTFEEVTPSISKE